MPAWEGLREARGQAEGHVCALHASERGLPSQIPGGAFPWGPRCSACAAGRAEAWRGSCLSVSRGKGLSTFRLCGQQTVVRLGVRWHTEGLLSTGAHTPLPRSPLLGACAGRRAGGALATPAWGAPRVRQVRAVSCMDTDCPGLACSLCPGVSLLLCALSPCLCPMSHRLAECLAFFSLSFSCCS